MNRRRAWLALAIALPLALGGAAKWATRWRPVALARLAPARAATGLTTVAGANWGELRATTREVADGQTDQLYDLESGRVSALGERGVTAEGTGLWRLKPGATPQLLLSQDAGPERAYALPLGEIKEIGVSLAQIFRIEGEVWANPTRVDCRYLSGFRRFDARTGHLQRAFDTYSDETAFDVQALSRDGHTIISVGPGAIRTVSARTGHITARLPAPAPGGNVYLSTYGSYALYEPLANGTTTWSVVGTANARLRWSFTVTDAREFVILAPDESRLAIARPARHIWEVRDLRSGAITQTLPLVPGAIAGAFSPDGATFYSVAEGVLYRQRAR